MFDLSQIPDGGALYCLRFCSGALEGTQNSLEFSAEYDHTMRPWRHRILTCLSP